MRTRTNRIRVRRSVSLLVGFSMVLGLQALAAEKPKSGVFTVAVFGESVYIGRAYPYGENGVFHLVGYSKEDGECKGSYRYHPFPHGRATFTCTNGFSGKLKILADENLTGKGWGEIEGQNVTLVYGYSLGKTNRLLDLPDGRELRIEHDALVLATP